MISLPTKYYLTINEPFELFFRGVIRKHNPYLYYIIAECEKGFTYNRYFTYTPEVGDEGEYPLTIHVYSDGGKLLESKTTILVVNKQVAPIKPLNILCIGDSETINGVWPDTGFNKYNELYPNMLNFIGTMYRGKTGYEGYGGWQWKTFFEYQDESPTTNLVVETKDFVQNSDIDTIWINNNLKWKLRKIEGNTLTFSRLEGNYKVNPEIKSEMILENSNKKIKIENSKYVDGNPFWNNETGKLDFKDYVKKNKLEEPDLIFTFLTGNGLYMPYSEDFTNHKKYAPLFLENLHQAFPRALIGVMGIELSCPNGGVTACYGASGYYHDWFGYTITAFNYDEWLEKLTLTDEFKDFVFYNDIKGQFDSEYNYPTINQKVNKRNELTERLGVNGLHPSMNGYLQIGDTFYQFLVEMIIKYNNRKENK